MRKLFVIGLDCLSPVLLSKWLDELPAFKKLASLGSFGQLKSSTPPITCPAWMSMFTGKTAGELGVYGFRKRKGNSYSGAEIVDSTKIDAPTVWQRASDLGLNSCILFVPPTYPPKPLKGWLVSDFLTPSSDSQYSFPLDFKAEVEAIVGKLKFDAFEFRSDKKAEVLEEIREMTVQHFKLVKHLAETKDWQFFAFVEIGLDRVHHAFWKYFDESHKKYEQGTVFSSAVKDYYKLLDKHIGELLPLLNDAVVLVVSDHGAKKMDGCFCLNQWLEQEGYLVFKKKPSNIARLEDCEVDWKKTRAWAWGGYYGRVFLNVKGRENEGCIEPGDYEKEREKLALKIAQIRDDKGKELDNLVLTPKQAYGEGGFRGDPSDLMVFLGDLSWRIAGTVGHPALYLDENDTGPDDAVHDWNGTFIAFDPLQNSGKTLSGLKIEDVCPTILHELDCSLSEAEKKRVIKWR